MDWIKAMQFGQLVNAAYDVFANEPAVTPGFDVLATIVANDLATDMNPLRGKQRVSIGLIFQEQGSGNAVVAIRGTEGIKEWVQDANFGSMPFRRVAGAGCTEDGFTVMYESMTVELSTGVLPVVDALAKIPWKKPGVNSLTICGHSLGGSLATLFALDVAANAAVPFNTPTVYTYASPRTGDHDFAVKYHQTITTTYRLVDNVDLVPQLPGIFPYRHVTDSIGMDSLTLVPPRVMLQPNPLCWHIMSSYMYLMSLSGGGTIVNPEGECAQNTTIMAILGKIEAELSDLQSIKDKFTASPRRNMGGNSQAVPGAY
jgi:hypothetical protein